VAGFVGRCNLIAGTQHQEGFCPQESLSLLPAQGDLGKATFALRPERVSIAVDGADGVAGQVSAITYLGSQTEYHVDVAGSPIISVQSTPQSGDRLKQLKVGDQVRLKWKPEDVRLLPFEQLNNQGEKP
jgi:putative spermidine/putrescine transport system ATP-binding protein